jgi:hypothetical protein
MCLACLSWLLLKNESLILASLNHEYTFYWQDEKYCSYATYVRYCVLSAIFDTLFHSRVYALILMLKFNDY